MKKIEFPNFFSSIQLKDVLVICLIALVYFNSQSEKNAQRKEFIDFNNALQDSVSVKINKFGERVSEISQIRTSDPKVFLSVKSNDAEIKRLQEEVNKYKNQIKDGSSVTIFDSDTKIDTSLVVKKIDENTLQASASDGKWFSVDNKVKLNGEPSTTSLRVHNEYSVALVKDGNKDVVDIKNKNPFSTEGVIRTYVKIPKENQNKLTLGIGPSYNPSTNKIEPISINLSYTILKIL